MRSDHGANIRLLEKAERIRLDILANIGNMEIAGPDITISTDHMSTRSTAHRLMPIQLGRSTNFRTTSQRTSQIQGLLHIDEKSRENMQVLGTYLQVPSSTYKRRPAGGTHTHIMVYQHQGNTNIIGEAYNHERDINIDKSFDRVWRANNTGKRSTGEHVST